MSSMSPTRGACVATGRDREASGGRRRFERRSPCHLPANRRGAGDPVVVCTPSERRGTLMSTETKAEKAEHADGAIDHLTTAERVAVGRSARAAVLRGSQASWEPQPPLRDPVELLEEQAATRVPELVPIRYGRMLTSPFAFYRGAALLMAVGLAGAPRTTLKVQL